MTALTLDPIVGDVVWLPSRTLAVVVHDPESACRTPFGLTLATVSAMHLGPEFCGACWPGRRCAVCRMPSGGAVECGPCTVVDIDREARYVRAAEWCAA